VDDIIVYSNTYEGHIKHLDAVLGEMTTAGFNINIDKCNFCKQEIKFVGRVVSDKMSKGGPGANCCYFKLSCATKSKRVKTVSRDLQLSPPIYHKLCRLCCAIIMIAQKGN